MPSLLSELLAIAMLAATLGFAVARPRGLPEALVAVPAAGFLVIVGVLPLDQAKTEARSLLPTVAFLAAVLVLADLCDRYGLFAAAGGWIATGSRGRPVTLLGLVFAIAAVVTAVLSLDATVVLLTPVVFTTVARLRLRAKPHVYACTHLANSASLLLPVSNLTNLLAFEASGLSFARFGATMALPWIAAIAVEWLVLRRFFASDLVGHGQSTAESPAPVPVFALVVVGLTLVGFFVTSLLQVSPAFAALAGCGGAGRAGARAPAGDDASHRCGPGRAVSGLRAGARPGCAGRLDPRAGVGGRSTWCRAETRFRPCW